MAAITLNIAASDLPAASSSSDYTTGQRVAIVVSCMLGAGTR
jgi:hypothetical protein